jgi:hypothetical protein
MDGKDQGQPRHFAIQGVDAIFEFNWITDVTAKFVKEHPEIVMVTGDYVVEGAHYFGANQYQAGLILGRYLAGEVKKRWGGKLDAMVFAACYQCGEPWMDGIQDGYRKLQGLPDKMVFRFENAGGKAGNQHQADRHRFLYRSSGNDPHVVRTNNGEVAWVPGGDRDMGQLFLHRLPWRDPFQDRSVPARQRVDRFGSPQCRNDTANS